MQFNKGERLALGTFVICKTETLCEAGLAKLDEIRKSAIRIVTNAEHPIRPYIISPNKLDEYAMRPRNPQLLFVRTAKYLKETQIHIRRIVNEKQFDVRLSAFGPETSSECYRTERSERLTKIMENTTRYMRTDRRWETK
jgi:hypothetical protein